MAHMCVHALLHTQTHGHAHTHMYTNPHSTIIHNLVFWRHDVTHLSSACSWFAKKGLSASHRMMRERTAHHRM